jgi:ribosomal protein L24E
LKLNCETCKEHLPPEETAVVVDDGNLYSFCSHKCAGAWAIKNKKQLKHILYFTATAKRASNA